MATASAPKVADMIRPKWWKVRLLHSGSSTTAMRSVHAAGDVVSSRLTGLVFKLLTLTFQALAQLVRYLRKGADDGLCLKRIGRHSSEHAGSHAWRRACRAFGRGGSGVARGMRVGRRGKVCAS
jgi:hypothetical protein